MATVKRRLALLQPPAGNRIRNQGPGVVILSELWGNDWADTGVVAGTGLLLLAAIVNASTSVHIRRHRWAISPMQALPWPW